MDCIQEAIALGVDVLIFGLCLKGYYNHKNTLNALKVNRTESEVIRKGKHVLFDVISVGARVANRFKIEGLCIVETRSKGAICDYSRHRAANWDTDNECYVTVCDWCRPSDQIEVSKAITSHTVNDHPRNLFTIAQ